MPTARQEPSAASEASEGFGAVSSPSSPGGSSTIYGGRVRMKLRWRKRPSANVLHLSVLVTFGSALPLAIRSVRPALSMGARHPVMAGALMSVLATTLFMGVPLLPGLKGKYRYRPFCMTHESCHLLTWQKRQRIQ